MPEHRPTSTRAYVGSPVTAESGVFLAIRWAFSLDHSPGWRSIGIIVLDTEEEHRLSHLHRMRSHGVRIGTIDEALSARRFAGVMIAYRPDPSQAELLERILASYTSRISPRFGPLTPAG